MNYTNNIDKYYIHAHYNHVKDKETNRSRILWLLLLIAILLLGLFFIYKSYQFNDTTDVYENSTIDSPVIAQKEVDAKELESKPIVASSAIDTAIEKLELVENQKLTESSRESVLAVRKDSIDEVVLKKEPLEVVTATATNTTLLTKSQAGALSVTETLKEKSLLPLDGLKKEESTMMVTPTISEKEKSVTAVVADKANATDINISKKPPLPMETFHLYVISKGETIYSIALKQYNDRAMYQKIIEANPDLENPNSIHEGQEILLPIVDEQKSYSDILHFK